MRMLRRLAFGTTLAAAASVLPPSEPLEDDPLLLSLLVFVAVLASDTLLELLGEHGMVLLTGAFLAATFVGLAQSIRQGHSVWMLSIMLVLPALLSLIRVPRLTATPRPTAVPRTAPPGRNDRRLETQVLSDDLGWLGRYQLLERLGSGGMGIVYLARAPTGKLVALKVMRKVLVQDARFLSLFRREIEAACRVPPRCTAPVLDADVAGPYPYIVTEYIDGPTLAQVLAKSDPLPPSRLENLALGIAVALKAIHGAGVVHRDLKPANVMLPPGGTVVVDFGIATLLDGTATLTRWGSWRGTPAFMAPEQFTSGPVTAAADIFAWGVVVALAATGRLPYGVGSVGHDPPDLTGLLGGLRTIVQASLSENPADRPSADELVRRLIDGL
jgi:hypothetical protein